MIYVLLLVGLVMLLIAERGDKEADQIREANHADQRRANARMVELNRERGAPDYYPLEWSW